MKISCTSMTIIALFVGSSAAVSSNLKVTIIKIDKDARKKTWSYKVIPAKVQTFTKPKLKKFKEDAEVVITSKDFGGSLEVYTDSTGSVAPKTLLLAPSVITMLKNADNGIAIAQDGSLSIAPLFQIRDTLEAGGIVKTRQITVEKVGKNRDEWRIASWGKRDYAIDGVTIKKGNTKPKRRLDIPADERVVFILVYKNEASPELQAFPNLIFEKDKAAKLKVLKLNDEGKQVQ